MSTDLVDLTMLGERLARVRRTYGESIDVPNLGRTVFAGLLGVSATAYASYERGEREPTIEFLVALRDKTRISLDWLLDTSEQGPYRPFR
jgi:transcriptional regulator with XRE-family HTH domain